MPCLEVQNICKAFATVEGERQVLKNVSFTVEENSLCLISGENGSGKSVLMNIIAGLEQSDKGKILIKNKEKVGLVFQEAETQILGETPREDISFGPKNLGWPKDKINEAVEAALEKTGLTNKADFPARFLSGGEKRRLAVACMLAMDLSIIILDEPYANLDYSGVKQVNRLLRELKNQNKTIILLSHEIEKCLGLADKTVVLFRGEKTFEGSPEELLNPNINMEQWNIRNPLVSYNCVKDMVW